MTTPDAWYWLPCRSVRAPRRYAAFVAYTLRRVAVLRYVPGFGWIVTAPGLPSVYFWRIA